VKESTDEGQRDEAALRSAVLRGDDAAWRALFDRHFRALYAYVLYHANGDRMTAEEITQDCWLIRDSGRSRSIIAYNLRNPEKSRRR